MLLLLVGILVGVATPGTADYREDTLCPVNGNNTRKCDFRRALSVPNAVDYVEDLDVRAVCENNSEALAYSYLTDTQGMNLTKWDLQSCTSLAGLFQHHVNPITFNIADWDVSSITDFTSMFEGAVTFNNPLATWDVSNGLYFGRMFSGALAFAQDLTTWNLQAAAHAFLLAEPTADPFQDMLLNTPALNDSYSLFLSGEYLTRENASVPLQPPCWLSPPAANAAPDAGPPPGGVTEVRIVSPYETRIQGQPATVYTNYIVANEIIDTTVGRFVSGQYAPYTVDQVFNEIVWVTEYDNEPNPTSHLSRETSIASGTYCTSNPLPLENGTKCQPYYSDRATWTGDNLGPSYEITAYPSSDELYVNPTGIKAGMVILPDPATFDGVDTSNHPQTFGYHENDITPWAVVLEVDHTNNKVIMSQQLNATQCKPSCVFRAFFSVLPANNAASNWKGDDGEEAKTLDIDRNPTNVTLNLTKSTVFTDTGVEIYTGLPVVKVVNGGTDSRVGDRLIIRSETQLYTDRTEYINLDRDAFVVEVLATTESEGYESNVTQWSVTFDRNHGTFCDAGGRTETFKVVANGPDYLDPANFLRAKGVYNPDAATNTEGDPVANDEGMLENLIRSRYPVSFVHRYELMDPESGKIPVPTSPKAHRMTMPTDPRCLQDEICYPSMCVMLDMNYWGYTVANGEYFEGSNPKRTYIPGTTYCGPIFGSDSPLTNDTTTTNDKPLASFPQARSVPVEYTPVTGAGAVLPLATETRLPSWYYTDGYFGWRQNGERRSEAPGCFGRHVPRWMVPPTCKRNAGEGCVNGFEDGLRISTARETRAKLRKFTLADDATIGLKGLWASGNGSHAVTTSYYADDPSQSRIKKPEDFVEGRATSMRSGLHSDAVATHLWTNLYYTVPATGLNGFSPWESDDWAPECNSTDCFDAISLPFPPTNERPGFSGATPKSVQKLLKMDRDPSSGQSPQQTMPLHFLGSPPSDQTSYRAYSGARYENKRLYKFTPEGMYSAEMFQTTGVRQYFHPLFEYFRPVLTNMSGLGNLSVDTSTQPSMTYFGCDFNVSDSHRNNCAKELLDQQRYVEDYTPEPFGASFINIEQAMIKFGTTTTVASPTNDTTIVFANLVCSLQGSDAGGSAARRCCLCSMTTWEHACNLDVWIKYYPHGGDANEASDLLAVLNQFGSSAYYPISATCKGKQSGRNCITTSTESEFCLPYGTNVCGYCYAYKKRAGISSHANVLDAQDYASLKNYYTTLVHPEGQGLPESTCVAYCNPSAATASRQRCADYCSQWWYKYLISPYQVVENFALTWPHRETRAKKGGIQFGFKDAGSMLDAIFAANKGLLDKTGRFMTAEERATPIYTDTSGDELGLRRRKRAMLSLYTTKTSKQAKKDLLESTVDESMCDLSVCDIADSETWIFNARNKLDEKALMLELGDMLGPIGGLISVLLNPKQSISPFRCVPKGYAQAHPFTYSQRDLALDSAAAILWPESEYPLWYTKDTLLSFYNNSATGFSTDPEFLQRLGIISVPMQLKGSYKRVEADYSKVKPIVKQQLTGVHYRPVERDAGYSGRYHDNNANPCDCSRNRIVLRQGVVSDDLADHIYAVDALTDFNASTMQVVQYGLSWYEPPDQNAPSYGLYLGSTSRDVDITERDMLDVYDIDGKTKPLTSGTTYSRWLQSQAPIADFAPHTTYTHVAGDNFNCTNPLENASCTGLAAHTFATEYSVTVPYSCARYPLGRLHRNEMHPDVRAKLYKNQEAGTSNDALFPVDPVNQHSAVNQGYCEKPRFADDKDRGYRFCPGDIFSANARRSFCEANLLATHFLTGIMIKERPFEKRCISTPEVKLCLVVPGYTAAETNSQSPGQIGAHTDPSGDVAGRNMSGYTLLVAPWNYTYSQFVMRNVKKSLQATPDPASPYMIKLPKNHEGADFADLNYSVDADRNAFGFKHNDGLFDLLSDLTSFVTTTCSHYAWTTASVAACIVANVDTFIEDSFLANTCDGNDSTGKALIRVPALTDGTAEAAVCVPRADIFPPNQEVRAIVTQPGMTVRSASDAYPLQFAGPPATQKTATCVRFLVSAPDTTLAFDVDQTECTPSKSDRSLLSAVILLGNDVSGSSISTAAVTPAVPILVLGETVAEELVPSINADNVALDVNGTYQYELGASRAVGNVTITCTDGACVVLNMPTRNDSIVFYDSSGTVCQDGTFRPEFHPNSSCVAINVTAYVGVFGFAFEKRVFAVSNAGSYESYIAFGAGVAVIAVMLGIVFYVWHDESVNESQEPDSGAESEDDAQDPDDATAETELTGLRDWGDT